MRPLNSGEFDWTPGAIERLTTLWMEGVTSGEISRQMGVSRSSVMGKLRRLDMLRRDRPRPPMQRVARNLLKIEQPVSRPHTRPHKRNKRPRKTPDRFFSEFAGKPPPPPPPEPPIGSFDLADLRHGHCRWPGPEERPPYSFCGAPQASQSSYCETHYALAHNRGSQRDYDRMAEQALAGKLFASRAGVME